MIKELPTIPTKEWLILAIGGILFGATEVILFVAGYTNLLYNTILAFVLASVINYGAFTVKNKVKRILKALGLFTTLMLAIPRLISKGLMYVAHSVMSLIKLIPAFLRLCIKALPPILLGLTGVILLNIAMIPALAVYLTIYGIILSLSGGAVKTILKHYDAFGHKLLKPIEKYICYEAIVAIVMIAIFMAVWAEILTAVSVNSSITSATVAANVISYGSVAVGTTAAYLPLIAIVIVIAIIIFIFVRFFQGAGAYQAGM